MNISTVSSGKPAIRSILILSKPIFLAISKHFRTISGVCFLPTLFKVCSFIVCGLMLILFTPPCFASYNLSFVIVSGLPASRVNSFIFEKSKFSFNLSNIAFKWCGSRVVGVPPPIYIFSTYAPILSITSAVLSISKSNLSTNESIYFPLTRISVETNEQYKHLVGQNGMPIYILTEFSPISSSKIFSFFATLYARSIFSSDTS